MTAPSEPLNVRVALVLGWTRLRCTEPIGPRDKGWLPTWTGYRPEDGYRAIPPYGADTPEGWSVTGPLLQRFHLELSTGIDNSHNDFYWCERDNGQSVDRGDADTACEAIASWVAKFGGPDAAR